MTAPRLDGRRARSRRGGTVKPKRGEDMRMLLVDDNMINRKVGGEIPRLLGCEPVVVSGALETVASCQAEDCHTVLMDIEMPDMDGVSAAGDRDTLRIRARAHALKSNAREFGATAPERRCRTLEHQCQEGTVPDPDARLAAIDAELAAALAATRG